MATAAGACGGGAAAPAAPGPAVSNLQLTFAGQTRDFRVYVPPTLDRSRPAPLVLVLGGVGDNTESMTANTGFDNEADKGGFVVAYAQSVDLNWEAGFCCLGQASSGADDVGYLGHLLDRLEAGHRVDAGHVYVVGVSAGAMMAYRLGCEAAGRIAGIGSVAGAMVLDSCHPARPVSVIELHGTADPLVPYAGGAVMPEGVATEPVPSSPDLAARWAAIDGCPPAPATTEAPPVTTSTWSGCAAGTGVRLVTIAGGGHTWYSTGYGPLDGAVDATGQIWGFLAGLRRPPAHA